jgi:hypothetical protein
VVPIAKPAPRPIYKRWWFWTVIGVAVVGVATTTGVLVDRYKPNNCNVGGGDYCTGFSF